MEFKGHTLVVVLGVVGALVGSLVGYASPGTSTVVPAPSENSSSPTESRRVPVHVSGYVAAPGVVWVDEGVLTADAINAAGGALPGADLDRLNLAQPVFEGDRVLVPALDPGAKTDEMSGAGDGLIDINRADIDELQKLPGVGPVLAGRIVAHRESVGRFETIEDLLEVAGIGETRLASIRELIRPP